MNNPVERAGAAGRDILQGYACLVIAAVLGVTVVTIMILSVVHWVSA